MARKERVKSSPRALSVEERERVLQTLNEDRFVDKPPETIHAMLLDEGVHLCSTRTMYRVLKENDLVKERRRIVRHRRYEKPELQATQPNQVWCWDVTKLRGPIKGEYYYLCAAVDIYSRYIVGWMVANHENAGLAREFIKHMCQNQAIEKNTLIIHSDRGAAMTSKTLKQLYDELQIERSFSRPRVSNDNAFVESHFTTLKYRPDYPNRFNCLLDARHFCKDFFNWYNNEHRHSGIAFMTPYTVHNGLARVCSANRQRVLEAAYQLHPERFLKGKPKAAEIPKHVCINPPSNGIVCSIIESARDGQALKSTSTVENESKQPA